MRALFLGLVAILVCNTAWADTKTDAELVADLDLLVAATPDGAKIWTVLKNGVVRHNNSGLVCSGMIGNQPLRALQPSAPTPVPDGSVNCHYSNDAQTAGYDVYALSLGKAFSVEDAFMAQRTALLLHSPDAVSLQELTTVPGMKGEVFRINNGGKRGHTCLLVGTVNNWIVIVRFTTIAQPDLSEADARSLAGPITSFAQALAYRAMRGVVVKQLAMPDPNGGF